MFHSITVTPDGTAPARIPAVPTLNGIGGILVGFIEAPVKETPAPAKPGSDRLGAKTHEPAGFLPHRPHEHDRLPQGPHNRIMLARIDSFIDDNLGDSQLSPSFIAARHHISVRTLHWLFRCRRRTVSAAIRHRRLERCRADLADGSLAEVPIHTIAARWGFTSAAGFSRAFRGEYAITARDFRSAASARLVER
ncbi:helix-turn-helix domain-containing protein [Streptomyces olivoreticuli]